MYNENQSLDHPIYGHKNQCRVSVTTNDFNSDNNIKSRNELNNNILYESVNVIKEDNEICLPVKLRSIFKFCYCCPL